MIYASIVDKAKTSQTFRNKQWNMYVFKQQNTG